LHRLLHSPTARHEATIPAEMQEWFVDRKKHPAIPPSTPAIIPENPIVILITIDCVRADVVMSGKHDAQLPALADLRQSATVFANARSTAPATISSLASIFMSTHFSQQYWVPAGTRDDPFPDKSLRLQNVLAWSKIKTVTFTGAPGLTPKFGLLRGFSESKNLQPEHGYAPAEKLLNAAFPRLEQVKNEKLFLYLHFLEAHYPYDLGIKEGSQYDRYISELRIVDKQLARLKRFILTHDFANRTLLIISADHGEAFGEHGTTRHSATVYDELLRVPLLIWRPAQQASLVNEPVSLIDIAPTILDVFGVPTPGHFMGQSLVPFLRGENPKLTRPILAEARLKQALILPDGMKVILDNHLNTVELYDLRRDPGELDSLAEDEEMLSRPLSLLQQFFEVHRNRTPGYTPPYRTW
jgi:arylsulfatase A-like enzyme